MSHIYCIFCSWTTIPNILVLHRGIVLDFPDHKRAVYQSCIFIILTESVAFNLQPCTPNADAYLSRLSWGWRHRIWAASCVNKIGASISGRQEAFEKANKHTFLSTFSKRTEEQTFTIHHLLTPLSC